MFLLMGRYSCNLILCACTIPLSFNLSRSFLYFFCAYIFIFFFRKDYVLVEEILKDIESDEETKQDNHEKQQQKNP